MENSFSERLKHLRAKMNLSQQQLADHVGLSRKQISDYEVKNSIPRSVTIHKLAEFLGTTPEFLLKGENSGTNEYLVVPMAGEIYEKLKRIALLKNRSIEDEAQDLLKEALVKEAREIINTDKDDLSSDILERITRLENWINDIDKNNPKK
ncbi:helix-turn-helix transcriptional regulator [Acinetobacter bereziniae]|uniref:HTH cro/C1-type domain-containing protein n=1 Tax=Acinetobacter bereziniae LMG 1003 = CIP 70.12 TaxID=981324 RepID=N9DJB2_ACIBZ|nr:helix-turn-helix transcriptional regulator [Acinetobacter bereziniae]ENV98317.1 hypothetical protein F938_01171 [Acinetobacter bereziniae LMG 1003 = CIP 70.12]MBJ9908535.1 helix-turn-helix transcriptional regulator [Acinetobacter bereziniae]MBJ9929844.1 helix-turn-helix transcriptional regulator [Acinetobacter bereziniae]MDG3558430.1 helix-turn-helix transcriptional regulator [Acinetobacter bereziniae]MDP6003560.1 helix-turn-helix transcriptional regulator [Acinetobacter bereziniae]